MSDVNMSYAKVVAIAKRFAEQSGGSGGTGGVSVDDFEAHVLDNKRHLTNSDREKLAELFDKVCGLVKVSTFDELPKEGEESAIYLVLDTENLYYYDSNTTSYKELGIGASADDNFVTKDDIDNLFGNSGENPDKQWDYVNENDIDNLFGKEE